MHRDRLVLRLGQSLWWLRSLALFLYYYVARYTLFISMLPFSFFARWCQTDSRDDGMILLYAAQSFFFLETLGRPGSLIECCWGSESKLVFLLLIFFSVEKWATQRSLGGQRIVFPFFNCIGPCKEKKRRSSISHLAMLCAMHLRKLSHFCWLPLMLSYYLEIYIHAWI